MPFISSCHLRHASNELNWQVEDLCTDALVLKQELVREFEEADLRTYRLIFAIKTQPKTGLPGSILIKVHPSGAYEILHTTDFNPNSNYITYKVTVKRESLSRQLINLCNSYYDLSAVETSFTDTKNELSEIPVIMTSLYECIFCKTIYDSTYGDVINDIPAGTLFADINANYKCPTCEADKNSFVLTHKSW